MLSGEGGYGGSNPPLNLQFVFQLCTHKKYCPSSAPVFMKFKNFVQENVTICTGPNLGLNSALQTPWLHPFYTIPDTSYDKIMS